jgi:hypothetical protein
MVQILKVEAEKRDIPLNALVTKILNRNIAFEKNITAVPTIIMPYQLFTKIIDNLDDAEINSLVEEGLLTLKKLFTILGKRYELKEIIGNHFIILEKYCGWYGFIYESKGPYHRLVFETTLGPRWTRFVFIYTKSILESLRSVHVEYESVDDNVVVFEVRESFA